VHLAPRRIVNIWAWILLCALLVAACGRLGTSREGAEAEDEEKTAHQSSPSRSRASGSCPLLFPPQDRSTSSSCPP